MNCCHADPGNNLSSAKGAAYDTLKSRGFDLISDVTLRLDLLTLPEGVLQRVNVTPDERKYQTLSIGVLLMTPRTEIDA